MIHSTADILILLPFLSLLADLMARHWNINRRHVPHFPMILPTISRLTEVTKTE